MITAISNTICGILTLLAFVEWNSEPDLEVELRISASAERIERSPWADMNIGESDKKTLTIALETECHNVIKYCKIYF